MADVPAKLNARRLAELEATNAELRRRVAQLEAEAARRGSVEASERSTRADDELFRSLAEHSLQGSILIQNGCVIYVNPAYCKLVGRSREELLTWSMPQLYDLTHPDDIAGARERQNRFQSGERFAATIELRIRHSDGAWRWVNASTSTFDVNGIPARLGVVVDITERKQAEAALRASESNYRTLVESACDAIIVSGEKMRILDVNAAASRMLGYTRDELLSMHSPDVISPSELARIGPEVQRLKEGEVARSDWQCRRKDGSEFSVEVSATVLPNGRLLGILRDVSERKEAELRIRHLNRVYAVLSDINQNIVREKDLNAMLESACRTAVDKGQFQMAWIGMSDASKQRIAPVSSAGKVEGYLDLLDINLRDPLRRRGPTATTLLTGQHMFCNHIDSDPIFAPWRDEALKRGYRSCGCFPLNVDGATIGTFNLYSNEPGFFDEEELRLLDELALDIGFALEVRKRADESRAAEKAFRASEARFREMLENLKLIAVILDTKGTVTFCNDYLLQLTGWTRPEILGANWFDIFIPDSAAATTTMYFSTIVNGEVPIYYENPIQTRRGELREIQWNNTILRDSAGNIQGAASVGEDVTERKRAEAELRQTLGHLRQLASRLETAREEERIRISREVHDVLGQNLTALKMDTEWVRRRLDVIGCSRLEKEPLIAKMERVEQLLSTTLLAVRRICMELRPSELDNIGLDAAMESHARAFQENTGIQCRLSLRRAPIKTDTARIGIAFRIFQEIMTNVARHSHATTVRINLRLRGEFIVLTVNDNGVGFSPGDTTGRRTLGILGMNERALACGGCVDIQSSPGKGTVVQVYIPLAEQLKESIPDANIDR